jgi:hypothetical protein
MGTPAMKFDQVRRHALSLPEATEAPHFNFTSFRVRGKIFATAPPGGEYLHVFVGDEDREVTLEVESGSAEKLWWGPRVVGLRISLAKAGPGRVKKLLDNAWLRKAPKSLWSRMAK